MYFLLIKLKYINLSGKQDFLMHFCNLSALRAQADCTCVSNVLNEGKGAKNTACAILLISAPVVDRGQKSTRFFL